MPYSVTVSASFEHKHDTVYGKKIVASRKGTIISGLHVMSF